MAAPKGMWECKNCGEYVPDSKTICPCCGTDIHGTVPTKPYCAPGEGDKKQGEKEGSPKWSGVEQAERNVEGSATISTWKEGGDEERKAGSVFLRICNALFALAGIVVGFLSTHYGKLMVGQDIGSTESFSRYGGDAYTGMQNASAQTANNVRALSEITRTGFGYVLIVVGLIAIFYFAIQLCKAFERK